MIDRPTNIVEVYTYHENSRLLALDHVMAIEMS